MIKIVNILFANNSFEEIVATKHAAAAWPGCGEQHP